MGKSFSEDFYVDPHNMNENLAFSQPVSDKVQSSDNWQQQLELVQNSRKSKSAHFFAHLAAQSKRSEIVFRTTSFSSTRKNNLNELCFNEKAGSENENSNNWSELDMSGVGVRSISLQLQDYTFLTHIYLCHNKLREVHPALLHLKNLVHLDLSNNEISVLPPKLGHLTNLKSLLLFDNNIVTVPFEFGNLFHLEMLGLEGNPLNIQYKQRLIELGTFNFISKLRDSAPLSVPPPPREWLKIEEEDENSANQNFKIMNYNILCAKMATPQIYGYTPSWALDWDYRKELILLDIQEHMADIVCLQELDIANFEDYFLPNLSLKGYEGVHYPKSRAKTMSEVERRSVDGCAIFYNSANYVLLEKHVIEFNQANCLKLRGLKPTHDMYNRLMTKDNIATVVFLADKRTKQKFIVTNAHIHWDPKFSDVKLLQVMMLLDELTIIQKQFRSKLSKSYNLPLIICGDFNSEPNSGVYDFLSKGQVASDHPNFLNFQYGDYINKGCLHSFGLKSAYGIIGELPMTNHTPNFTGVLDYIWFSSSFFDVTALLGEISKSYIENSVGFPDPHFPSE